MTFCDRASTRGAVSFGYRILSAYKTSASFLGVTGMMNRYEQGLLECYRCFQHNIGSMHGSNNKPTARI